MNFEIGKLYKCTKDYLLIYPTEKKFSGWCTSYAAVVSAIEPLHLIVAETNYWSEHFNCKVHYSVPNEPFLVLKKSEINDNQQYINVLFPDKSGWIIYDKKWAWIKFERII